MAAAGSSWTRPEIEQLLREIKAGTPIADIAAAHKRSETAINSKIATEIGKLHAAGTTTAALVSEYGFDAETVAAAITKTTSQCTFVVYRSKVEAAGGNWAAISSMKTSQLYAALAAAYPMSQTAYPASQTVQATSPAPATMVQSQVPIVPQMANIQPPPGYPVYTTSQAPASYSRDETYARGTTQASAAIGVMGEAEVARGLSAHFSVKATAGAARAGDMHICREGRTILVEVKNYTNPVPGAEIDKFSRDIETHSEVAGGLFVSLRSPISCQPDQVRFAEIGARPAILLHGIDPSTIPAFALVLDRVIAERAAAARSARSMSARSSEAISAHLRDIAAAASELSLSRTLLCELQDGLNRGCGKVQSAILAAEHRIATHIDALMDTIHDASESQATIPENLPNATREAIREITPDAHCLANGQCVSALGALLRKLPRGTKLSSTSTAAILAWPAARLEIAPLKTRTNLSLVPTGQFTIPRWCKYDRGTITAQMDAAFITTHLEEFIALMLGGVGQSEDM